MADDVRSSRLRRFLATVAGGNRTIRRREDAILLLGALCAQPEPVQCVSKILSRPPLLNAVRQSLRMDLSDDFLSKYAAPFIQYISSDDVRNLNGGQVLLDLETAITDPPLLWDAMKTAATQSSLSDAGLESFGLLSLDLLTLLSPTKEAFTRLNVPQTARALCYSLLNSQNPSLRILGYKVQEALRRITSNSVGAALESQSRPGGRHDNDFADFRKIAIFPTTDELLSKEEPFYQTAESVLRKPAANRVAAHLDNQFRLLREDFMKELREDLEATTSKSQHPNKRRAGLRLRGLQLSGVNAGASTRLRSATIAVRCWDAKLKGLPADPTERKNYFAKDKTFLRHGSFGCLLRRDQVICFATVERDVDQLARNPSVILLRVFGHAPMQNALLTLKAAPAHEIEFAMVDTPFFAYEPVLNGLQQMAFLPLAEYVVGLDQPNTAGSFFSELGSLASSIEAFTGQDLSALMDLPKQIELDQAQTESMAAGLTQAVSLVQGPPGTGKSFLGALLVKAFLEQSTETILVLCYTNHALDQFLEDIMDIGVSQKDILRLGVKHTLRTHPLLLTEQTKDSRIPQDSWHLKKHYTSVTENTACTLERQGTSFSRWKISDVDLLRNLEFSDADCAFFDALTVPDVENGMTMVAEGGKMVDEGYLLGRWKEGKDAGVFRNAIQAKHSDVWDMNGDLRGKHHARWVREAIAEKAESVCSEVDDYERQFSRWKQYRDARSVKLIESKRIIGCTTTGAAKYTGLITAARPGIVLVEEAGEVLESHVLTALGRKTKKLVLIGDHLQLRPKVVNHSLTVEKGEGFNLNMSLFERLVVSGYPHTVLTKQHRMRPEISALVRRLMYPDLQDGDRTKGRERIRGLQSNVVFINHEKPEEANNGTQRSSDGYKKSRKNLHEVLMVLKIVRYLAQQGYGTDSQVVLTPYLGQLRLLMDHLKADHDPVLNDLDSHDLIKAGLLNPASATVTKRPLRISTIDNYQGEESSIVIVSLTRSNAAGDVGFLSEAQRLNVLLSRARDGLIIIGNVATFRASKKGGKTWDLFFQQLSEAGQLYDGLPIQCEKHPQSCNVLSSIEDFNLRSPNGGCNEPCQALLSCKRHHCPEKCHQLSDHSKVKCQHIIHFQCAQNHQITRRCWEKSQNCATCERLKKERNAQEERDLKLAEKREALENAYFETLSGLDKEIAEQRRITQEQSEATRHAHNLEQKRKDLNQAKTLAQNAVQKTDMSNPVPGSHAQSKVDGTNFTPQPMPPISSQAKDDWERHKRVEAAQNEHIDVLMDMVGLEAVKRQVLDVKDKIDTALRQGTSLASERFGAIFLGNPGTGKTTVARLYAKCLASMGVVPGCQVEETTASKLTNGGAQPLSKLLEKTLNAGGGMIFIDEAYQLASDSSGAAGKQILDALLDAAELHKGKVVFFLAGYKKEMEDVLSHNPGLPSRFPHEFLFEDYTDQQLLAIFQQQVQRCYNGHMKLADGSDGLYARIVARRVGYGRERPGFGNARAVENSFAKIKSRQAARVSNQRRQGIECDDFFMSQEDLVGREPSSALAGCTAWTKLQELVGLDEVKQSVTALLTSLKYNYERELKEEPLLQFNLNRVFLGSPGTGKTTVAKLYGEILRDLGLLSNGQVMVKNPSDFVGEALGVSEKNTKGILAATAGKVLVIDEAYGLCSASSAGGQQGDPYKASVIDTLVAEVQSVPGDDRCVLLLGYRPQMEAMFQSVNPGLSRRFPLSEAFQFADFSDSELNTVAKLKLRQQGYETTEKGMQAIMESLGRARNKPNFGNAGEVDILLNSAKARHMKRQAKFKDTKHNVVLEADDIDPEFDRAQAGKLSVHSLFQDTVGAEKIIHRLEAIQKVANNLRRRDLDPRDHVPFNFRFVGPPGTGKTTTARKMGELYYDIGILATKEVLEVSATDLVGEYVGQTGPKTQKLLEKALGKVLFIDEAYRLAEGHFAKDAMDEIVDRMTKPEFTKRLIVVLAGYDRDMQRLMSVNPGLPSRFPESVVFHSLPAKECWLLLQKRLQQATFVSCSQLENSGTAHEQSILAKFRILTDLDDWANARDVNTLASAIANAKLETADVTTKDLLSVTPDDVVQALDKIIAERKPLKSSLTATTLSKDPVQLLPSGDRTPSVQALSSSKAMETGFFVEEERIVEAEKDLKSRHEGSETATKQTEKRAFDRDVGVSDESWAALERDEQHMAEEERRYHQLVQRQADLEKASTKDDESVAWEEVDRTNIDDRSENIDDDDDEEPRLRERERVARESLRRKRDEVLEQVRRKRAEKEHERQQELENQRKLQQMGVCPMGFHWIKQSSGYRCAGGSHVVSNSELQSCTLQRLA